LRSDGPPELHYSTQKTGSRPGSHSDMVDPRDFVRFLRLLPRTNVDVMLEAKSKDLALLTLRRKLTAYSRSLKGWVVA
jgi:UV DNA damage endonuclease